MFEADEEVIVHTPSLEGILGDKLTVFAPHTAGIPFGAGKSMEIVKQLFNIGELFDHCKGIKTKKLQQLEAFHYWSLISQM